MGSQVLILSPRPLMLLMCIAPHSIALLLACPVLSWSLSVSRCDASMRWSRWNHRPMASLGIFAPIHCNCHGISMHCFLHAESRSRSMRRLWRSGWVMAPSGEGRCWRSMELVPSSRFSRGHRESTTGRPRSSSPARCVIACAFFWKPVIDMPIAISDGHADGRRC